MKKTLSFLFVLTVALAGAVAQDATTTVQVAPSDQVIYPDASAILNKTEAIPDTKATPKAESPTGAATTPKVMEPAPLSSSKPVVGTTPVPAKSAAPAKATTKPTPATPPAAAPANAHGWFLRWTVSGDEAGVQAWAAPWGASAKVRALGPDLWEVLVGPVAPGTLDQGLKGQGGKAQLVRR